MPLAEDVRAAAAQGQFCPKMCTFACPVATATGFDEAVPWSFHREVADLAAGWSDRVTAWERLSLCNGCLACRSACTYEQDVPAQVVAARTALASTGQVPPTVAAAISALAGGLGPDGRELPPLPEAQDDATTTILVGVAERPGTLVALATLTQRAGLAARFVRGQGAAAGLFEALGHHDRAATAEAQLGDDLEGMTTVVVVDPDLLATARRAAPAGVRVTDVASWLLALLEGGSLMRTSAPPLGRVTWHDPDAYARTHDIVAAPRQVLRLLGGVIVEPEGHGPKVVSAGTGLGMDVLAPAVVARVAMRRAGQLAATAAPTITVGGAATTALEAAGLAIHDLAEVVADRTQGRSGASPTPAPPTTSPEEA